MIVIRMGVSGSGNTTVGSLLAREVGWDFYDADDFHSPQNIAKMSHGLALTDKDRQPWLQSLRALILDRIHHEKQAVIACSALREIYRASLHVSDDVQFVYLKGCIEQIRQRLSDRQNHYTTADLLAIQFSTLEKPAEVLSMDVSLPPGQIVDAIRNALGI